MVAGMDFVSMDNLTNIDSVFQEITQRPYTKANPAYCAVLRKDSSFGNDALFIQILC